MLNALASANALQDLEFFVRMILGNENSDRFSDNFGGGIAKEFFRGSVPACDDTIQIFTQDCVFRRFHQRAEKGFRCFRLLPSLAFGDVAGDFGSPYDTPDAIPDR